ncbi:Tol-Pal system beta propeller repeat protein TolB [hydrothermal vent metagenome]|uniref:Tol-Pal system beta propeller repeat protein TolB n=1 Tax=hydrothermal vent metagenome TaxID=652676 RepID=A0A3B0UXK2_9ZZZZ
MMSFFRGISSVILALLFLTISGIRPAAAMVYLDITSADLIQMPVAVPAFVNKNAPDKITAKGRRMADLAGRALALHGFISIVPAGSYAEGRGVDWQKAGADFVMLGSYNRDKTGLVLEIRFIDLSNKRMIVGKRYHAPRSKGSLMIRKFCDEVIYKLSGRRGISNTEIAFVSDGSGYKEVYVADILSGKARQITRHHDITVSPRFTPDGRRLVYTSYHRGNPDLYITNLAQSRFTRALSWRKGLNLAPSWAPDGKTMLITLSKDGNPDIYLLTSRGRIIRRITKNDGINVSPSWSPDGRHFAFVSDRSGTPQIYTMDVKTGITTRITYQGAENTTPAWSPSGTEIAFTGRVDNTHQIYIINANGGQARQLTKYWGDYESPSWSPDSRQLVFSRQRGGRKELCRIFIKGHKVIPMFKNLKGNQTFPQWSPRLPY